MMNAENFKIAKGSNSDDDDDEFFSKNILTNPDNVDLFESDIHDIGHHSSVIVSLIPHEIGSDENFEGIQAHRTMTLPKLDFLKDSTYLILFIFHFIIIVLIASFLSDVPIGPDKGMYFMRGFLFFITFLYSVTWLIMFISNSKRMLSICYMISMMSFGTLFLISIISSHVSWLLWLICTCFIISDTYWVFKAAREHFQLVSVLFEMILEILHLNRSLVLVTIFILFFHTIWLYWCIGNIAKGIIFSQYFYVFMFLFHLYWTTQVFKNICTVIVSGTVMMWYYESIRTDESHEKNLASENKKSLELSRKKYTSSQVVAHFLRSSLTSSFGSICLGSILCPIAHITRIFLQEVKKKISCTQKCFVDRSIKFIQPFHNYSFTHVAVYGKSFYKSAKDSWILLEEKGVDVIIDNDLTSRFLFLADCSGGGFMATIAGLVTFNEEGNGSCIFLYFLVGYCSTVIITQLLNSIVKTLFVCFAENPKRLSEIRPIIYHRLVRLSELKSISNKLLEDAS